MTTTAVTNLGISPSGTESIIRTSVTILVFFDRAEGKALGPVKKTSDYDLGTKLLFRPSGQKMALFSPERDFLF